MFEKNINFISTKKYNLNNSTRVIKSIYCFFLLLRNFLKKKNKYVLISYNLISLQL